jgi:hypothetical protein
LDLRKIKVYVVVYRSAKQTLKMINDIIRQLIGDIRWLTDLMRLKESLGATDTLARLSIKPFLQVLDLASNWKRNLLSAKRRAN